MRILYLAAPILTLALAGAGCSKPAEPANADVATATDPAPGAVDNQTMEQALAQAMNRFAKLDLNGDGKLTQEELNAATEGGDPTANVTSSRQGFSARAFDHADANGDGVVTREEARAQAQANFKAREHTP